MTDNASLDTAPQVLTALLVELGPALPFVILRNYEGLPDIWGNDVDVLIRPSDLATVRKITLRILRRSPHFPAACIMERLNFWSINLPCVDRELQIDFYTAMSKAWITYADSEVILAARRQIHPLFCIPDPLHELLLIAAKELFAYGRIRSRYHKHLAGHEAKASLVEALKLFSKRLTKKSCCLVAQALTDPTITGKPKPLLSTFMNSKTMWLWIRLRKNTWKKISNANVRHLNE